MIQIEDKSRCCGCTACQNVCPKKCISMEEDREGFLYPVVNKAKCINCKLCEQVCPIINNKIQVKNDNQVGYIVANKNSEILKQSTSGGAFTEIASYVISNKGIVYGVEMHDDFTIRHVGVEKIDELYKFRNSKYVQSNISDCYRRVKVQLEEGRMVCFSGTPCQIEGLCNFLNKDYNNLVLVDVVCRAVPSPGVWKRYVSYVQEQYGEVKSIRFRDKTLGYQFSTMEISLANGTVIRNGIESDTWLRMFFSGMIIRPSCSECSFRKRYRRSDFTIWDCFDVSDVTNEIDEKQGATRILIHTDKGVDIFNQIKDNFHYIECKADDLVGGMKELSVSPGINPRKEIFFNDYERMSMQEIIDKYFPKTMSVYFKKYARIILNKLGIDVFVKKIKRKIKG